MKKGQMRQEDILFTMPLILDRVILRIRSPNILVEIIQYLLEKGADVNVKDQHGITPLLAAVYENHPEAVKALVEAGADKSSKGPDGMTALEAAESDAVREALQ